MSIQQQNERAGTSKKGTCKLMDRVEDALGPCGNPECEDGEWWGGGAQV